MSYIETSPIKNTTTMLIYAEKDEIKLDPPYQRMGGVWTLEKRQLLIDSILNDYDIPKIYFHIYSREEKSDTGISYSVIDGRQRLETIWQFIEGKFSLSSDFEYQKDPSIDLSGLGYEDIAKEHPRVRIQFDSFVLPIVGVNTDDLELIEDMFSRLNEAVPLNAAEKRNAFGGNVVRAIREVASHNFFTENVKFSNKRYQHLEVAARILLTENSLRGSEKLIDTKKVYLDRFAKDYRMPKSQLKELVENVINVLDIMSERFLLGDELLRAQGNMVLYYLIFRKARELGQNSRVTRRKLLSFRAELSENRRLAEEDYSKSRYELLEYDRLSQQGTNDSSNIRERFRILSEHLELMDSSI
ncbi:DUF262 domain-containing protein [Kangiella sp. HD9-110m-PIT-SAG07]|nr:DUF262 domain-containing protein [Kangiella sp. HD9-110m-PIT-SAG07]